MADTKQGQVDWVRLAVESAAATGEGLTCPWLRTTFEPIVKAAYAVLDQERITSEGPRRALRAALDGLPKVGGG